MGQEFGDDGKLIKYSNLFDYSSLETLQASSWLPTPRGLYITTTEEDGLDISELAKEISKLLSTTDNKLKALKIRKLADLIIDIYDYADKNNLLKINLKIDMHEPLIAGMIKEVAQQIIKHERTKISANLEESAYKNSISFNIKNIVLDLKNMDLAYSPIAMDDLLSLAAESEKGALVASMSLMNPLTKYMMLVLNMVGKKVIGIAAVGEKVFFNLSYYFNEGLRSGDEKWIRNLQFSQTFNRILNRYKYNKNNNALIESITKTQLANINFLDDEVRRRFITISLVDKILRKRYGITLQDIDDQTAKWFEYSEALIRETTNINQRTGESIIEYHKRLSKSSPVDLLISLILSAATDNAKELILAKINCSANLAKCHLYLTMLGFDIRDTVSFMTSPCVSLVNDLSEVSMMDSYVSNLRIDDAIEIADGLINPSNFLFGVELGRDEEGFITTASRIDVTFGRLKTDKLKNALMNYRKSIDANFKEFSSLEEYVLTYIKARVAGVELNSLDSYTNPSDYDSKKGLLNMSDYVERIIYSLDKAVLKYSKRYTTIDIDSIVDPNSPDFLIDEATYLAYLLDLAQARARAIEEFSLDLAEFKKVYKLANETTTLGGTFLGMNLGLPSSKEDLQSKLRKIGDAVTSREKEFGIRAGTFEILISPETRDKVKALKAALKNISRKFRKLIDNNSFIVSDEVTDEDGNIIPDSSELYVSLELATAFGIVGNFDVEKWLYNVLLTKDDIVSKNFYGNEIDINRVLEGKESISYREVVANYYNIIKGTWNIFDMMNRIPQYKAIIELLKTEYVFDKHSSVKSGLVNVVYNKVYAKTKFIDERQNKAIIKYVDDLLITSYFRSKEFRFPIFWGTEYLDSIYKARVLKLNSAFIDLNNAPGRASFKKVFETIISDIRATGRYGDVEIPKDNAFLKGLRIVNDKYEVPRLSLDLDMMKLNSTPYSQRMFLEYLNGFNLLKLVMIGQNSLADWIILYNLYVNLNQYGSDRLTTLFKNSVANKKSVLEDYFKYIGNLDFSKQITETTLKDLEFNMDDLLIRLAPTVLRSEELDYASKGVKFIRSKNENKEYVIKKLHKVGKGKNSTGVYKEISTFPNKNLLDTSDSEVTDELKYNYLMYLMIPMKNQDFNVSLREGIMSSNLETLVDTLISYSKMGLLKILKMNC